MVPDALQPTERLGFVVYRSGLAVARGYERALSPIGATPTDAGVLSTLASSGENHTRGLARLLGLGRQTVVNVTRRLEESGLIRRAADARDGRLALFAITEAGRRRLAEIETVASAFDQMLRDVVGAQDEAGVVVALRRILADPRLAHED